MRSILVFSLLVLSAAFVESKETCKTLDFVNGCSTPLWLPVPFKKAFTPSCNRHDVCYRCGMHYKWSQEQCDEALKRRMYEKCEENPSNLPNLSIQHIKEMFEKFIAGWKKATAHITAKEELKHLWDEAMVIFKLSVKWFGITDPKEKCPRAADIYFKAVRVFGVFAYMQKSPPHCLEKCAAVMGDPFH